VKDTIVNTKNVKKLERQAEDTATFVELNKWHKVNKVDAANFWGDGKDKVKTVQLGVGNGINGIAYTDFISSRIEKCKLTFGGVISNSNDSLSDASKINNFINGGGNAILKAEFPLSTIQNINTPDLINATLLFTPRIAGNLPKLANAERIIDWNIDTGFEIHAAASGKDGNLGIVGKIRAAVALGSEKFAEAFLKNGRGFAYIQISGGLIIKKDYLIVVNIKPLITGSKTDNFKNENYSTVGIQALF
jgi:hypothetical protein